MSMKTILAAAVMTALAAMVYITPANAQASRTWVAGLGDDANPCSRSTPCKTFAGAMSKTATGGEINCLDGSGFGTLNITKSINIYCDGVAAGVLSANTTGVTVNAPGSIVVLRGLDIAGYGTGINGINFIDGAELHVENCLIRGFRSGAANGILFAPIATSKLFVSDTVISSNGAAADPNGSAGIQIQPTGGGSALVELERVLVKSNVTGLRAQGASTTGSINATVRDSVVSGHSSNGIEADGGGAVTLMLEHVASVNNAQIGVLANGATATVLLANSQVLGNDLAGC